MSKALVILAVIAVLAYMWFFNTLKFHQSTIHENTETSVLHQAGGDENDSGQTNTSASTVAPANGS